MGDAYHIFLASTLLAIRLVEDIQESLLGDDWGGENLFCTSTSSCNEWDMVYNVRISV